MALAQQSNSLGKPPDQGIRTHYGAPFSSSGKILCSLRQYDHPVADLDWFWLAYMSWSCLSDNACMGDHRQAWVGGLWFQLYQ